MSENIEKENLHENCETELKNCTESLAQVKERFIYLNAEFDNFKKRVEKERTQWIHTAQSDVICDLLIIVDNFERALSDKNVPAECANYVQGFDLIAKEFHKILGKYEVEEIACSTEFNPAEHEAIMQAESDKHTSGAIVDVLQKGYRRKSQILRPAKVSVAK